MPSIESVSNPAYSAEEKVTERDLDWGVVQRVQAGKVGAFDILVQKFR